MRGARSRWAAALLFIEAPRGSETAAPGGDTAGCSTEIIPLQSCKRDRICSWHSLRVPWLYKHVDVPQRRLLMRAWSAACFSHADCSILSVCSLASLFYFNSKRMKWCCASFEPSEPFHHQQFPLVIIGYNSRTNLARFIHCKILALVDQFGNGGYGAWTQWQSLRAGLWWLQNPGVSHWPPAAWGVVLLVGAGPSSGALAVPSPLSLQSESHTSNFPDRREKTQLKEAINRHYNPASRLEVLSWNIFSWNIFS